MVARNNKTNNPRRFMEEHHLSIPMSPPASPYPSQAFVFPEHPLTETKREKNCSPDDVFRYIGIVGSLAGLAWAFWFQPHATTGGILFTVTGSAFIIGHITDKTCGAKARIMKAAIARIDSFKTTLQTADHTVNELRKLSQKWKSDTDLLASQKQALTEETLKLQQTMESLKSTIATQQQENVRLQDITSSLQQKISTQETQIATLNGQIGEFTAHNQQFHKELQQITATIPAIKQTGKNLSHTVDKTAEQLEKNLGALSHQMEHLAGIHQFVAEISAEHAEMKSTIARLTSQTSAIHTTTDELGQHLQTLTQAQAVETHLQQQMSQMVDRLSLDKQALVATEQRIKNTLRQKKPEEKKGDSL